MIIIVWVYAFIINFSLILNNTSMCGLKLNYHYIIIIKCITYLAYDLITNMLFMHLTIS